MKIFNSKLKKRKKRRPLTKTEFILITMLFFVASAYVSMNYLILPKLNEYKKSTDELKVEKMQCESLRSEFENLKKMKEDRENLKCQITEVAKTLPPYISEEDIILTIGKYGKNHSINIQSVALNKENQSEANNFVNAKDTEVESEHPQSNKATNDGEDKQTKSEEVVAPTVLTKYITVAFSGNVENLYSFIENFEKNDKKLTFKEMALNKDKDKAIGGTMKFQYIGYKDGKDGSKYNLETPEIDGKTTPFDGGVRYTSIDNEKGMEGNFSLVLNKYDNKSPKFIFGEYKKTETEIYNSTNGKISGKFTIEKEKGSEKFAYTYSLGNNTKTEKKTLEIINGKLILVVNSNLRDAKEDMMKLSLDVENKTEYPLEIYISNDDVENPRFVLGNKQGNVYLKQMSN